MSDHDASRLICKLTGDGAVWSKPTRHASARALLLQKTLLSKYRGAQKICHIV